MSGRHVVGEAEDAGAVRDNARCHSQDFALDP